MMHTFVFNVKQTTHVLPSYCLYYVKRYTCLYEVLYTVIKPPLNIPVLQAVSQTASHVPIELPLSRLMQLVEAGSRAEPDGGLCSWWRLIAEPGLGS